MDEETVKALIAAALGEFEGKVTSVIDSKNQGLAASLTREIKKLIPETKPETPTAPATTEPEPTEGKLTLKALQSELSQVRAQLEKAQKEREDESRRAFEANKASALTSLASKYLNPGILRDALDRRWGDKLKQEGDRWFIQFSENDVKPLDEAFKGFMATDEGKAFIAPSPGKGAGSSEAKNTGLDASAKPDLKTALMEAF
jgi:hypothetical protein